MYTIIFSLPSVEMGDASQDNYLYAFVDSFCESDTNQYAVDSTPGENYLRDRLNNVFQSWYQSVLDIESFEQKTKVKF